MTQGVGLRLPAGADQFLVTFGCAGANEALEALDDPGRNRVSLLCFILRSAKAIVTRLAQSGRFCTLRGESARVPGQRLAGHFARTDSTNLRSGPGKTGFDQAITQSDGF